MSNLDLHAAITDRARVLVNRGMRQEVAALLKKFGATKVSEVQTQSYPLLIESLDALIVDAGCDLIRHMRRVVAFSSKTFGPGERTEGILDHITKEMQELREVDAMPYATPVDRRTAMLREWIDLVILALDGCWRTGASPEQIVEELLAKQTINEGRTWPDWRTAPQGKAIEHDRSHDDTDLPPETPIGTPDAPLPDEPLPIGDNEGSDAD